MSNDNLETVIEDSLTDAQLGDSAPAVEDTPEVDTASSVEDDTPAVETAPEAEAATPQVDVKTSEEEAPVVDPTQVQDEFEKKFGLQQISPAGRENRIPYSRVKAIAAKSAAEVAEAALGRKLAPGEKALDVVKAHVARLPELETKVTDYEGRLERVGQFEEIMSSEPQRFLGMLAKLPAYADFFAFVERALDQGEVAQPETPEAVSDGMPEPDEELSDGSKIYSMEGIKKLLAWNSQQTEQRVTRTIENKYQPIEAEWKQQQHVKAVMPLVRRQIEEAKTWELFSENEEEITKVLAADPNISLEGAYRKVVFPKLAPNRDKMRQEILAEVKKAPRSTAVTGGPTKPVASTGGGPRSLTDIIEEQVQTLK